MLKIAYSPVYKYTVPEGHRFPMIKYELVPEQLIYEGTVDENQFFHPDQLTHEELLLTHTEDFLTRLNLQQLTPKEIRKIGFPMTTALVERGKYISKGTYLCAIHAMEHGVSMNVAGGTHHSYADHGEGFCIYNDFAIACNLMLDRNQAERILIVDLDVHQGIGTAKIFENRPEVFTFSMHGAKNYPAKKEKSDLDIPIPDKCEDAFYLQSLKNTLPRLIEEQRPDFVFYLAGADILESDKLGRLSLSLAGAKERDRYVLELCKLNNIPVAISMGGGYSEDIRIIVDAHANTFRLAQEIFF
jgi:acetoin utilization deacetylase AcuC-like enzyme